MTNVDLLDTLRRIEKLSRQAQLALQTGAATNGHSALKKIHNEARDAIRHHNSQLFCRHGIPAFTHCEECET